MRQSFIYQSGSFFAQVPDGLEKPATEELTLAGATKLFPVYRGIHFQSDLAAACYITYTSRCITRILAPLHKFACNSTDELYDQAGTIAWEQFLDTNTTFAIFATVAHSAITHSQYAGLRLKDAIVDYFKASTGMRPSVDTENPDLWINLRIDNNRATVSADLSGGSLHKRGYKVHQLEAPMQELLAAAIIRFTGWDGSQPLYDPMCGSGTLLAEAHMSNCRIPAQYLRKRFGFERFPDFDRTGWIKVATKLEKEIVEPIPGMIGGSDIDPRAVSAASNNLRHLPGGRAIEIKLSDFRDLPPKEDSIIVCNPPYGLRLKTDDIGALYGAFGDFLKHNCKGSTAYIYCGNKDLITAIGLKPSLKKPLPNGPLDGRLVKIEVY